MFVVPVSNKTVLVRHWLKWYRVQRGGEDWRKLEIKPYQKPKSIAEIAKSLEMAHTKKSKKEQLTHVKSSNRSK